MAGLINLPGYAPGNALNFSGINQAIDSNRQNALAQRQMGIQDQQLGMQKERLGMERETHGVQMQQARTQQGIQEARQAVAFGDHVMSLPEQQRQAAWEAQLKQPGWSNLASNPQMRDVNSALPVLKARAAEYMGIKERAQVGMIGAQTQKFLAEAEKDRREAATGGKRSLVPIYGKDAQGNDVLLQTGPGGDAALTRLPPGVSVSNKTSKIDLGTHWGVLDARGELIGRVQKDVAGEAAQRAQGAGQGQAQVDLPKVKYNAATTIKYIDDVLRDENLGNVTGAQGYLPTIRSASRDTEARISQLGGRAFLSAFETLKGGGQITEIEGKKATEALARLTDLKQSDSGYRQALKDFRGEVMNLVRIAEQRARGGGPYVPPAGVPTDGVRRPNSDRIPPPGAAPQRLRFNPATGELE